MNRLAAVGCGRNDATRREEWLRSTATLKSSRSMGLSSDVGGGSWPFQRGREMRRMGGSRAPRAEEGPVGGVVGTDVRHPELFLSNSAFTSSSRNSLIPHRSFLLSSISAQSSFDDPTLQPARWTPSAAQASAHSAAATPKHRSCAKYSKRLPCRMRACLSR